MTTTAPDRLHEVLRETFGVDDPRTTSEYLHGRLLTGCGGANPPSSVQLVWQLLHRLPSDAASHPGSSAWRTEARRLFATLPVYVEPTRRETADAIAFLRSHGLLPAWVRTGAIDADAR